MKIIHRYIFKQISSIFVVCLIVFTSILFMGNLLRVIEMVSKGIRLSIILRFLLLLVPFMLAYSIPISILTSVLLAFSRMSADNEITAIRASGINLKHIFKPILLYSLVMVSLCYIINDRWRPNAIFSGRKLLLEIGIQEPTVNLSSGRFNEIFQNYVVYVEKKQGRVLERVVVYKFENDKLNSVITADSGQICYGNQSLGKGAEGKVGLKLNKGIIEEIPQEGQETGKVNRIMFETYVIEFDLNEKIKDISKINKKEREMSNVELINRIDDMKYKLKKADSQTLIYQIEQEKSSIKTRIQNRIAISFSCLAFALIGIPLGIRVHRSEASIGAGISLILLSIYYFLMTLGEAFQNNPHIQPWLFMWIPNLMLFIIGFILIFRLLKK